MSISTPTHLVQTQRDWSATYQQLAQQPGTALRRRLLRLSAELASHRLTPAQRQALRDAAREQPK